MATATIPALEPSIQKTSLWLSELSKQLDCDQRQAYQALRACLHALRDRLTVEEASDLASQLPMVVRGIYYESWNPSATPSKERHLESFLARIRQEYGGGPELDPQQIAQAVFALLTAHCTMGQIEHVRSNLPEEIRELWQ